MKVSHIQGVNIASNYLYYPWLGICSSNSIKKDGIIERGDYVVTHETRIREIPGSNPVVGQAG